MNIDVINAILDFDFLYDRILTAVEEYINVEQIELNFFLDNFTFEVWSHWFYNNKSFFMVQDLNTYLQAIEYLSQADNIDAYVSVNHTDFIIDDRGSDFYLFIKEV